MYIYTNSYTNVVKDFLRKEKIYKTFFQFHNCNLHNSSVNTWQGCVYVCVCVRAHARAYARTLSRILLFATPQTAARWAPLSMGFSRKEYGSGAPFPSPGNLPDSGMEPGSPALQADSLLSEPPGKPSKRSQVYLLFRTSVPGLPWTGSGDGGG